MFEETSVQLMRTSSNDIRRGNMGTHQPSKEQASSCTKKDGKEYVKHHIPGQKNKHLGKRKDKGDRRDWISQRTDMHLGRAQQNMRIKNNRWTLRITTWKTYEKKRPRGRLARQRDELDDNWQGVIWLRITQDRQMWKQHAETFAQPRDTMTAQWWYLPLYPT